MTVRRTRLRMLAAAMALLSLTAACGKQATEDPLATANDKGDGWGFDEDLDDEIDEPIDPETSVDDDDAPTSDEVVQAALLDAEGFWQRSFEDVYGDPYEEISGGFWAYGPDTEQPPCGDPPPRYNEIAGNAFYCPTADLIAWDNENLVPQLYDDFGGFTLGIVFAHELGHAIQARADELENPTVVLELQADCFAGAWTADVEEGNADYFAVTLADLDKALAGFLELRDGVGTSAADPAAHGTGFDRIGAFSEGYEHGLERCAEYPSLFESGELVIVEVPFTSAADFERGGNLPLADLVDSALVDLEDFWTVLFQQQGFEPWTPVSAVTPIDPETDEVTCGDETYEGDVLVNASFYCTPSDTIYIDSENLIPALYEIGDYAVATELARLYAYAAHARLGIDDNSVATNLNADCSAGIYASSGFLNDRENQKLVLSPGDLDEAVLAFLQNSDAGEDVEARDGSVGTAFQRFDAYRAGFTDGIEACDALLEDG
jgi:predicted metalloprotease